MGSGRFSRPPLLELAAAGIATALAAGLVLFDLTTRDLWIDETTTWGVANQHGAALWRALLQDGGNMAGYYGVTHVLVAVFGSSALSLRLPVALAFVLSVPASYLLVRRLFDARAAAMAALLVAASEPLVYWGQQARGYLPAVCCLVIAALGLVTALQDGSRAGWVVFVAAGALAAYMILIAGLAVVAQLLALVFLPRRQLPLRRIAASVGALALLAVPLVAMAAHKGTGQLDWIEPSSIGNDKYLARFAVSSPTSTAVAVACLLAFLGGVAILAYRLVRQRRSSDAFAPGLLVLWALFPIAALALGSWLIQPMIGDRYLLPSVPAISMLAGVGLSRLRPLPLAWACCLVLTGFRVNEIPSTYGVSLEKWSAVTSYVESRISPQDCIAFFVADGFTAFDYYVETSPGAAARLPEPVLPAATWASKTPFVLDPATLTPAEFAGVAARCPRLFVVYTHQSGAATGPGVPVYQGEKHVAFDLFASELATYYEREARQKFVGAIVTILDRRRR